VLNWALGEFDSVDHLPPRILLCGGGASLRQLVQALEKREWYKELPFTKRPSVTHIKPSDAVGIHDTTGRADDHTYITAMGLLRVGYDTMMGHKRRRYTARQSKQNAADLICKKMLFIST
jgi:hypothetical protein